MLRYLPHHEINEKSWDNCLEASAERIIYACSWYLNVVCKRWDAVVEEDEQGNYISVFPLPLGRRLGQLGVLQPYFTQQLGLFTTACSKYKSIDSYLALIPAKYKGVYLQLNTANTEAGEAATGLAVGKRTNYHLPLGQPYNDLVKNYKNRHKLNKARRSGLEVKPLENIEVLIRLFKNTKGRELTEVKAKHYRLLAQLHEVLKARKAAELWQVVNEAGEAVVAAFFILQPDKLIFLFSGASEEGRRTAAMTLLLDSMIQRFAGNNIILDFEGSMVPSVANFYANFGAEPVTYLSLSRQHTPWYLKWKEAISIS
ncbi:GNAT family N-acetyltransferase [Pontibacter cellulosilyticus]|uniref:GNAT family N-acetyltransferase n=1 Tax=Pontibacter cellulosilyticus TaxID=1720253 RepID=A0A923ND08_9BACT|nr:GNAT family N-acetyltransferase [Pontibacter cellulosilyticus]MBC5994685.1 GNAT family N-acetyltransferase [Pontibacter cellulosilyticus]